jgi:hypothetical protein
MITLKEMNKRRRRRKDMLRPLLDGMSSIYKIALEIGLYAVYEVTCHLVRALVCQAGGRGFKSPRSRPFERWLVTRSAWDAFIQGDQSALTDAQKSGFNTFAATGCQWCHSGPYVGGSAYQKLGVVKPWPNQTDQGVYQLTKDEMDKMAFKVPWLRNIKKTGPYFHDGSVAMLDEAIRNMAVHQRGVTLTDAQVRSIEIWMDSLTGQIPASYIKAPELPKSTPQTPQPTGE